MRRTLMREASPAVTPPRARLVLKVRAAVEWLRAGYSAEAPSTGHCTLIALQGPSRLSAAQIERAVADIASTTSRSDVDIAAAITKAIDRLPTRTQIEQIRRSLPAP
ncbi:DUF3349 domain-containing protein [Mycobacterium sp. CPCC 205372]|uniref:DUF3349 domain-containing protein n=1 Tax=Mycobacterium hippophais TaxID=3016340 RepID=A0ABT4PN45_9MYCO|nr:DUF3349 domain-containing protein [Mycobacterium hippophais]MCZ8377989.1 DUF3349 domain-containing protein [Mycobacterium hippophais]